MVLRTIFLRIRTVFFGVTVLVFLPLLTLALTPLLSRLVQDRTTLSISTLVWSLIFFRLMVLLTVVLVLLRVLMRLRATLLSLVLSIRPPAILLFVLVTTIVSRKA